MKDYKNLIRNFVPRQIRNFARAPLKAIRYNFARRSYTVFGKSVALTIRLNWTIRCHPASLHAFNLQQSDSEQKEELNGFIRHSTPGMILLDIGAHYGFFTLAALHYGGPTAQVIAVDPSPEVQEIFLANLNLNHVANQVKFFQTAIGDSSKVQMLSTGAFGEYMWMAHVSRPDAAATPCTTLSMLIEKVSLHPTHIKIDVEGYERKVILGGRSYLEAKKPILFLELHSKIIRQAGDDPKNLLSELREIGYQFEQKGHAIVENEITREDICRFICVPQKRGGIP